MFLVQVTTTALVASIHLDKLECTDIFHLLRTSAKLSQGLSYYYEFIYIPESLIQFPLVAPFDMDGGWVVVVVVSAV